MSKEVTPEEFKEAFPQLANLFDECMGDMDAFGAAGVSQCFSFTLTGGLPVSITLSLGSGEDEEGDE